jgi:hypothetical protein
MRSNAAGPRRHPLVSSHEWGCRPRETPDSLTSRAGENTPRHPAGPPRMCWNRSWLLRERHILRVVHRNRRHALPQASRLSLPAHALVHCPRHTTCSIRLHFSPASCCYPSDEPPVASLQRFHERHPLPAPAVPPPIFTLHTPSCTRWICGTPQKSPKPIFPLHAALGTDIRKNFLSVRLLKLPLWTYCPRRISIGGGGRVGKRIKERGFRRRRWLSSKRFSIDL